MRSQLQPASRSIYLKYLGHAMVFGSFFFFWAEGSMYLREIVLCLGSSPFSSAYLRLSQLSASTGIANTSCA